MATDCSIGEAWFKEAHKAGVRADGWFEVKLGTPEDKAWREYFAHQDWTPACVRNADTSKSRSYTMPVQWPTWLPEGLR